MSNCKASALVANAVKSGFLPKADTQVCVDCGKQARVYDHRDYFLPLNVEPVCYGCNKARGPAMGVHDNSYNLKYELKLKNAGVIKMTFFAHIDVHEKMRNTARLSRKRALKAIKEEG